MLSHIRLSHTLLIGLTAFACGRVGPYSYNQNNYIYRSLRDVMLGMMPFGSGAGAREDVFHTGRKLHLRDCLNPDPLSPCACC